ncbi:uncharacterized protein LOC118158792 [Oxyura jamaicensis]|uniref:uncharacterized protein LOC118158792 n=1 Tax=Oxyura jamaicensis TaxID=8884 RepID=UPI0015A59DA7|nr:uncharacterized protein LOC118158792 [Oxyura jamaicensis]
MPPAIKSQLLTRQSCSLSRRSKSTREAKLGQAAGEKEPSPRLLTACQKSSSMMAVEGKGKRSAAAWPQTQALACEGHRRAGQQKTQLDMQRLQTESASSMALVELKKSLQMVPVDMKQQHVLIPHPPEKKVEAALSKSSTNCLSVRSVRVRKQLEKRKEAMQKDKTKSRAVAIPGNSAEDLLICVGEKIPVLPMPKMTRPSGKPARTPRSCEQLRAQ